MGAVERELACGRRDLLVREEPLLLIIHGSQLLTMRTPGRDEDLALGFLLGEGIISSATEVAAMQLHAGDAAAQRACELHIELTTPPGELARSRLARTHEIRSSCGVCGVADPATILDSTPPLLPGVPRVARAAPVEVDTLSTTARAAGGFGHTGLGPRSAVERRSG